MAGNKKGYDTVKVSSEKPEFEFSKKMRFFAFLPRFISGVGFVTMSGVVFSLKTLVG